MNLKLNHLLKLSDLRMDWRVVTVIFVSTLMLVFGKYRPLLGNRLADQTLYFMVIPLLVILLMRQPLAQYGVTLGDWKAGLVLTLIGCGLVTVVMAFVARLPEFRTYYIPTQTFGLPLTVATAIELFSWEFLFRGFLLFGLWPACGPYSIFLQAVPFTITHFGKPELETLSCIFGGAAYGYVAWRTRSFLYPFLIHWYLLTITVVFATAG